MESKAKLLGHPIHPMLMSFPLVLLIATAGFDTMRLITGDQRYSAVAYLLLSAGLITGVLAAIPGAIDLFAIPPGTRAKGVAYVHGGGNVAALVLAFVSWFLRRYGVPLLALAPAVLMFIVVGLLLVTGWLGGELVDRLGIGVDDGAGVDAPNSLRRPHLKAALRQDAARRPA